jgi:hypothetical protein
MMREDPPRWIGFRKRHPVVAVATDLGVLPLIYVLSGPFWALAYTALLAACAAGRRRMFG